MPLNIHQDSTAEQIQAVFHGMNAVDPPHLVAEDEVQTATNIDFTLEYGGAAVRRGSTRLMEFGAGNPNYLSVEFLNLSQGALNNADGVIYAGVGDFMYRVLSGGTSVVGTFSNPGAGIGNGWVGWAYKGYAYFMGGNGFGVVAQFKDDGVNTTDWIPQAPAAAPTVTVNTLLPNDLQGVDTFTASEGASVGGDPNIFSCSPTSFRLDIEQAILSFGLENNGTNTIGDYGIVSVQAAFSEPKNITRVSMDFGIGASFDNYYHAELDVTDFATAYPDPTTLVQSQILVPQAVYGTTTVQGQAAIQALHDEMTQNMRTRIRPIFSRFSVARETLNTWLVPKTNFETIFKDPNVGGWGQVGTGRIVIEGTGTFTAIIDNWQCAGAKQFSLNDVNNGYTWYETWAALDPTTGNLIVESAPSPPTDPSKVQNVNVTLTDASLPTGTHGLTHRIWYRQGGYLNAPYAVGTTLLAVTTFTDSSLTDMDALALNLPLQVNIATIPEINAGPRAIVDYYDRMFVLASNTLAWTLPGQYGRFPRTSQVAIGDGGDEGMALIPWLPKLVIVKDHSVYEMVGNVFEGTGADYIIARTGSKHGSKARLVSIKTPYGIPLLDYDGLYLYTPGEGIDQPLDWVMSRIGDMWRGNTTSDPAFYKGQRVPTINFDNITLACAAYADSRLYLALPTGTSTFNNTVVVIDFRYQKVFLFEYPFAFTVLFWDQFRNRLYCLTEQGNLMQLETGVLDSTEAGDSQGIPWNFKTRAWVAPADILMENIAINYRGGTSSVLGIYDTTNTVTIGTLSATARVWTIPTLGGTVSNDIAFRFVGTQTGLFFTPNVIYQMDWDSWVQPKRVVYYEGLPATFPSVGVVKTWLAEVNPHGGTTTGTLMSNGTALMTASFTGTLRNIFEVGTPNISTTKQLKPVYTSTTPFQYWQTAYEIDAKPFYKKTWNVIYRKLGGATQLDLARFAEFDIESTNTATIMGTWISDGTALNTFTLTNSGRNYYDRLSFPPGGFGYLFQCEMTSDVDFHVWASRLEMERIGVKGFTPISLQGTPQEQQSMTSPTG